MAAKITVPDDASVTVDGVLRNHSGFIDQLVCFFTVSFGKSGTHYAMPIAAKIWETFDSNDYNDEKLKKYLAENMREATFLRSCSDCRPLALVEP
jgi:hypothetical protein